MTTTQTQQSLRRTSYGQQKLTIVDRYGVHLSQKAIERAMGRRRDLDVLDLGCGYHATLLRALRLRIDRGVGVDVCISSEARAESGLSFVETTLENAAGTFPDRSYDLVLMISVLEHLTDPINILTEIRRIIRPGGALLINVPTWLGKRFLEFSAFRLGASPASEIDDHKMYFDKRDLWPLLVRAGFQPRHIHLKYHKFGLNLFATVHA